MEHQIAKIKQKHLKEGDVLCSNNHLISEDEVYTIVGRKGKEYRYCKQCDSLRSKSRRETNVHNNFCRKCGKKEFAGKTKLCKDCLEQNKKIRLNKYQERKQNGICTACGRNPPREGSITMCEPCYADNQRYNKYRQKRRKKENRCSRCENPTTEGRRLCSFHVNEEKKKSQERRDKLKIAGLCAYCGKNPVITSLRGAEYSCKECLDSRREKSIEKRKTTFLMYGGCFCVCCGEDNIYFLSIDHINGSGGAHRKEMEKNGYSTIYKWLKDNNYPSGFQVLCMNCNAAKGWWGFCPHERDKKNANF